MGVGVGCLKPQAIPEGFCIGAGDPARPASLGLLGVISHLEGEEPGKANQRMGLGTLMSLTF